MTIVCQERLSTLKGDARIECPCGMEYHALSGQPVEEPICERSTMPRTMPRL
ncbi:MAG: hypothetical protein M3256_23760 [Actinomycetota bacterium]|nr:hypothetical protein [Actinomycetota bacterium]